MGMSSSNALRNRRKGADSRLRCSNGDKVHDGRQGLSRRSGRGPATIKRGRPRLLSRTTLPSAEKRKKTEASSFD